MTDLSAIMISLFCIVTIYHGVFSCCMLRVHEYDAEDDQGNVTQMWSVLKVAPFESNPGFSLRQEDLEIYSDGGEDDGDDWVCCRAWPHLQMPARKVRPKSSQPSAQVPTLPQRVKQDLLEQHHHLCTLNVDPCKEYRYSSGQAVLSRVRQANKTCTICNQVCSTMQNLCRFKCSQCEHVVGDAHSLKVHSLMHAAVTSKHRCNQCPKSYNTKGHLNQHKKEHMGRAGPCHHCGKTFAQQSGLISHLKSCGPAPKRFKCDVCSREYTQQAELCHHEKEKHQS